MAAKVASGKERITVPFILTEIPENLSWKVWSENLLNSYDEVHRWIIGDLSGKIWAQSCKSDFAEKSVVLESETQKIINGVKNQGRIQNTGVTLGGEFFGFVKGNKMDTATFRSECGCVGVTILRNNYIIAVNYNNDVIPKRFDDQIREAAKAVKLLWY